MAELLAGVPIPNMDWGSQNLPEALRRFRRTCEYIFDGPMVEATEITKVQYLMLWVGEEGRDVRDGLTLTDAQKKKLKR